LLLVGVLFDCGGLDVLVGVSNFWLRVEDFCSMSDLMLEIFVVTLCH